MKHAKRGLAMLLSIVMVFGLMTGVGAPRVSASGTVELTPKAVEMIPLYRNTDSSTKKTTYDGQEFLAVPLSATTSESDEIETGYYVQAKVTWNEGTPSTGVNYIYDEPEWTLEPEGVVSITGEDNDYVVSGLSYGVSSVKLNPITTGVATLTWTCGEVSGSVTIRVVDTLATSFTLSPTSVTLTSVGEQQQLTPVLTPTGADASMSYWSADASVATVSEDGVITAVGSGTCKIWAAATGGNGLSNWYCTVSVQLAGDASPCVGWDGSPETITLEKGETAYMPADFYYSSWSPPTTMIATDFSYESSDESVVTVDGTGLLTAVGVGEATVSMTPRNTTGCSGPFDWPIVVTEATSEPVPVTSVTISQTSVSLKVGEYVNLSATVSPQNATDKSITWSSSDTSVASCNDGQVVAKKAGTAVITATAASDVFAACTVTVEESVVLVTGLTFSSSGGSCKKGDTIDLSGYVTISPSDANNKTLTWSSSDTSLATVSDAGVVEILRDSGTMQNTTVSITAKTTDGSDKSAVYTITIEPTAVTAITLSKNALSLAPGDIVTLSVAAVEPSNATVQTVSWASSDTSVATVDNEGKVTVVSEADTGGQAVITATADGGSNVTASCTVTVISADSKVAVDSVAVASSAGEEIYVGDELTISASVSPENATIQGVNWYITSGEGTVVAKISADSEQISILAAAPGTAVIEARAVGDDTKTASVTITVSAIEVTGISVSPSTLELSAGETCKVTAAVLPENATDKTVTWESSDEAVATVDGSGTITAVAAGEATITATAGGKSAAVLVTVVKGEDPVTPDNPVSVAVTGIAVSPTAKELTVGETCKVTAAVSPQDATDKTVTWDSSDKAVAVVDENGTVTAVAAGEATITATAGTKSATVKITVKAASDNDAGNGDNGAGDDDNDADDTPDKKEQTITAKTSYTKVYGSKAFSLGAKTNGGGKLTYKTGDKKIATVSSAGKVTIKGTGKVTITITAAETEAYKSAALKVTITVKPKKAALKGLSSKKKSWLTVTWKKDTRATGYEITVATDKKFTKNKKTVTVKSYKTTSATIKKLKSNKIYYVRIRSYKTVNGKKVYGAYSKVMKLKVK